MTLKKGGSFLLEDTAPEDIFTPEDFSEEQAMIRDIFMSMHSEEYAVTQSFGGRQGDVYLDTTLAVVFFVLSDR